MKKFIIFLGVLFLFDNLVFAETEIQLEKLDLTTLNNKLIKSRPTAEDPRLQSINDDSRMEGEDYMYRMHQQMMQPPTWNPYGGFRY